MRTITAFNTSKTWLKKLIGEIWNNPPFVISGEKNEKISTGDKNKQQNKTLRKSTGITALFSNDIFLTTSYSPSNEAEINAKINHMFFRVCGKGSFFMKKKFIGKWKNKRFDKIYRI